MMIGSTSQPRSLMVVWCSVGALVSINKLNLLESVTCLGSVASTGHLSRSVTSHPGQLSLAIPLWVCLLSTGQRVVMPCDWGVRAGMVRVRVAGKAV